MANESANGRDAFDEVAETFVARYRAGERPSVEEYARRCPEMADELRELLPTLVLLERHAAPDDGAAGGLLPQSAAPRQIGDFTIIREIGRGGMGVVYEAVQRSLGRQVALKVLSGAGLLNPLHLERFRLEARAAARLHHTHIVPVFGVGEHDQLHYYAMQFIQGQSLDLVIDALRQLRRPMDADKTVLAGGMRTLAVAEGVLTGEFSSSSSGGEVEEIRTDKERAFTANQLRESPDVNPSPSPSLPGKGNGDSAEFTTGQSGWQFYRSVARVGMQAAEALAYAHSEGVLHRDIKPSNLMLDDRGHVWVTDFGLAKAEGSDGLTHTGDFVGTLRYMAPERLDGGCDRRSDVYGLGATLYELVTLRTFLEDAGRGQLVERILHDAPLAPSKFDASIPRDLETIILKAIAKEPAARYRTAEAMAEDLRRFLADRPVLARRSTPAEQFVRWCRRNPLVASLTGAVAALMLAAVIILTVSNANIRHASTAKDAALATARRAVDQMLTRVASEKLDDVPRAQPLRADLFADAVRFYEEMLTDLPDDVPLRLQLADTLDMLSGMQLELGNSAQARSLLERSIHLLESCVAADPNPPAAREMLAHSLADLAFVVMMSAANDGAKTGEAERHFRRALETYMALERDWPDRLQPSVLCLRSLADLAAKRGDVLDAQRLWRQAVTHGEAYLDQHAQDLQERLNLCWACAQYYEAILTPDNNGAVECEAVISSGLRHATAGLEMFPGSMPLREVQAYLNLCAGRLHCATAKSDQAVDEFRLALDGIEALCVDYPRNSQYWINARYFHQTAATLLEHAGRPDEAKAAVGRMATWIQRTEKLAPPDPETQREITQTRTEIIALLRSSGQDDTATKLEANVSDTE